MCSEITFYPQCKSNVNNILKNLYNLTEKIIAYKRISDRIDTTAFRWGELICYVEDIDSSIDRYQHLTTIFLAEAPLRLRSEKSLFSQNLDSIVKNYYTLVESANAFHVKFGGPCRYEYPL